MNNSLIDGGAGTVVVVDVVAIGVVLVDVDVEVELVVVDRTADVVDTAIERDVDDDCVGVVASPEVEHADTATRATTAVTAARIAQPYPAPATSHEICGSHIL